MKIMFVKCPAFSAKSLQFTRTFESKNTPWTEKVLSCKLRHNWLMLSMWLFESGWDKIRTFDVSLLGILSYSWIWCKDWSASSLLLAFSEIETLQTTVYEILSPRVCSKRWKRDLVLSAFLIQYRLEPYSVQPLRHGLSGILRCLGVEGHQLWGKGHGWARQRSVEQLRMTLSLEADRNKSSTKMISCTSTHQRGHM